MAQKYSERKNQRKQFLCLSLTKDGHWFVTWLEKGLELRAVTERKPGQAVCSGSSGLPLEHFSLPSVEQDPLERASREKGASGIAAFLDLCWERGARNSVFSNLL